MPIPQPMQAKTPTRALAEYTVGKPDEKIDLSTAATSPTISSLATNPPVSQTIGTDSNTGTIAIASGTASSTVVVSLTIPLPRMPQNLQYAVNDQVYLMAYLSAVTNPISGLALTSFTVTPQAFGGQRYYTGPKLSTNVTYGAYNVLVNLTFVRVTATAAGTVTCAIQAFLQDIPG